MSDNQTPRTWIGYPELDTHGVLPLDLTPMWEGEFCEAGNDYICTRPKGHTGRHAASNGEVIVAVWE